MRSEISTFISFVIVCCQIVSLLGVFQQQQAKVLYTNPKYVQSVSLITIRHGRNSPYITDFNITTHAAWGNNVTIKIMFYKYKAISQALAVEVKTCDMMKFKWAKDWVDKYSNMSTASCPLKAGIYRFTGFEVPPKNFPIPIGVGDYESIFLAYVTKTKEKILETHMQLKFESKEKKLQY